MKLLDTIRLWCSGIGDDATKILHKKLGKTKGLDSIEQQIRDEATDAAKESYGGDLDRVAQAHIEKYVKKRMKYMRNAFKKLDNPKTDTSKHRGDYIGKFETRSAKSFGKAKGFERLAKSKKKNIYKAWVTGGDKPCQDCEDNEDQGPIPVEDNFQSGDFAPPAHVGCDECYLEYTDDDGNEA